MSDINPEAELVAFPAGVTPENIDRFLSGVDVYVDGIDFFAMSARRMLFKACAERGIPALTAAPLGMGVAFLYFKPGGMSFEDYAARGCAGRRAVRPLHCRSRHACCNAPTWRTRAP